MKQTGVGEKFKNKKALTFISACEVPSRFELL